MAAFQKDLSPLLNMAFPIHTNTLVFPSRVVINFGDGKIHPYSP